MKIRTIALASFLFALTGPVAFAQTGNSAGGSSEAGGPAGSKTTTGESMDGRTTQTQGGGAVKNGTTGPAAQGNMPSGKDASTQGAGPGAAVDKKGDATTPGATMKK